MNELFSLPPCTWELDFFCCQFNHTILTTIEYVISELAVFGLSRSIACIPRKTVRPTGVNYIYKKKAKQTNKKMINYKQ